MSCSPPLLCSTKNSKLFLLWYFNDAQWAFLFFKKLRRFRIVKNEIMLQTPVVKYWRPDHGTFRPSGPTTTSFLGNDIFSVSDKSAGHVVTENSDDVAVIVVGTRIRRSSWITYALTASGLYQHALHLYQMIVILNWWTPERELWLYCF